MDVCGRPPNSGPISFEDEVSEVRLGGTSLEFLVRISLSGLQCQKGRLMASLKEVMRKWLGAGKAPQRHHDSGAEGHALQVNSDPELDNEETPDDHQE